ncbi:arginyl-tRNA--protein transferase 1 isoform X1 [Drosophila grimshawi]|uniref:arginyl-tRNA--protein transferase 1 isoform X1 n=1 Tax=Drosophila grimshawi TaxID=7222 RepID=UPI000C86F525|nr:arginyl-tRNA--protein transferase 1 isoform X1 [Drosophila grimshawi]
MSVSIVQYFGEQKNKCGYCTGTECSKSHGLHAFRLSCDDYQELIDRGWRRCGNYCYKPQNDITCCPCYTIKCDAQQFKLTKSNKRILRRMNKFLRDGKSGPSTSNANGNGDGDGDDVGERGVYASELQPQLPDKKPISINVEQVETLSQAHVEQLKITSTLDAGNGDQPASSLAANKCKASGSNSNPPRKKAKQMRLERRQAKLGQTPPDQQQTKALNKEKNLQDFLAVPCETDVHKLKIVLVAASDTQRTCTDAVHALYRKYQLVIHNDNPARLTLASMKRFLVQSPLKHQISEDGPEMGYGSFHQQYWLDDKLIAVGVIDILPGSVSSVYFFYDPDYSFLSLGTYGSLREIDLVQKIAARVPALKFYYMGFYIHSCPKMRYKGKLDASYLLCPETYVWLPLTDDIRSKLDANKYQRLNPDAAARDANEFLSNHLNDVKLLVNGKSYITYKVFVQIEGDNDGRDDIMEYSKLVGKVCAQRMLYVNML